MRICMGASRLAILLQPWHICRASYWCVQRVPTQPESITVNSNVAQGIVHLRVLRSTFMVVSAELTVILSETQIEGSCRRTSVAARSSAG